MTITPKTVVFALVASAVLLFGFSFLSSPSSTSSPSSPSLPSFAPQESSAGNVTITVAPRNLSPDKPASFEVVFDTHSVNLDFDVAAAATLTDDQGTTYSPPTWSGDPPGGHHRNGMLSFSNLLKQATRITLILKDIAGIPERTFTWGF